MKNYINLGLIIVGVITILILFTKNIRDRDNYRELRKSLAEQTQKVKILSANELEMKDRQASYEISEILYKNEKDSLAKLLKVKPKTIKEYVSVSSDIKADLDLKTDSFINPNTKVVDSLQLSYNDSWISVNGKIDSKGSKLSISGKDSLLMTKYKRGNDIIVDVRNTNKYIHLTGASSLTITPDREKVIKISPFLGIGYDPFDGKVHPVAGVGITVNLKSIFKK